MNWCIHLDDKYQYEIVEFDLDRPWVILRVSGIGEGGVRGRR